MKEKDKIWALFWCSLLQPIIFSEVERGEVYKKLEELSKTKIIFPNGKYKKPSLSTLKRKLKVYRESGFEGLARKERDDRGKTRTVNQEIIDKAIELKKDQPFRSNKSINYFLKHYYNTEIPKSTLYNYLKQNSATKFKLGVIKKKVRCRWTRENVHELWIGDFSNGPYVLVEGQVVPTYLSLFIDCHSRYVLEARYYLRQNLDILIDSLLRAWMVHGIPCELYLDNAKIYHADALKSACYALKIRLIYRKEGDPSPGGLVERMFKTNQDQFESEVKSGDILTFDNLNKAFLAWLNVFYHKTYHSEIKQTPEEKFKKGKNKSRYPDMDRVIKFFMHKVERTVNKDFSDVSVNNNFYSVNPKFRGDRVIVRYDPFATMDTVLIYSLKDQYLTKGVLYQREKKDIVLNEKIIKKPKHSFINLLVDDHQKQINQKFKGIDYIKLITNKKWPLTAFIKEMAMLLGKKGISSFTTEEILTLKSIYSKNKNLNKNLLIKAYKQAESKDLLNITLKLQKLNMEE